MELNILNAWGMEKNLDLKANITSQRVRLQEKHICHLDQLIKQNRLEEWWKSRIKEMRMIEKVLLQIDSNLEDMLVDNNQQVLKLAIQRNKKQQKITLTNYMKKLNKILKRLNKEKLKLTLPFSLHNLYFMIII